MFEMGGESRYHQISRIRLDGASAHDWVSTTSGSAPFAIPTTTVLFIDLLCAVD